MEKRETGGAWYENPTLIENKIPGGAQAWGVSIDSSGKLIAENMEK